MLPSSLVVVDGGRGFGGFGEEDANVLISTFRCRKVIATVRPFSEIKWITNALHKADSPTEG